MIELVCTPNYPTRHAGPVIVAGGAACLMDDLSQARALRPAAPVLAVNKVGSILQNVIGVVSAHGNLVDLYDVPDNVPFHEYPSDQRAPGPKHPRVDYRWTGQTAAVGSSSLCAAVVALAIGFNEVLICGVPLEASGYMDGYDLAPTEFNVSKRKNGGLLRTRREAWERFRRSGFLPNVYSFSGATKDILGLPKGA
jgi:hypothetical protein